METPSSSSGLRPRRLTSDQARMLFESVLGDSDSDFDLNEVSDSSASSESNVLDLACGRETYNDNGNLSSPEVSDNEHQDVRITTKRKRKQTVQTKNKSGGKNSLILQASVEPEVLLSSSSTSSTWHDVSEGETKPEFEFHPPSFHVNPELHQLQTPMDFFKVFFDDDIVDYLIQNINAYAENVLMQSTPKRKHSRMLSWTPFTKHEWLKFTSVIISMGLDRRPWIKDYWSTTTNLYTPWYATMFSRNRFESIYHTMLHASEPDAAGATKIEPLVDMILKKFQAAYYPFENVSIDEMVIGWQGRFKHKQYNATKPGTVETGKRKQVRKPKMIHEYNMAMNGCDRMDQMVGYYNMHDRKTVKWWKKIYYWIFEIAQINAHILHTICQAENGGTKLSLKDFKQSLLESAHREAAQLIPESATLCLPKNYKKSFVGNHVERVTGAKHLIEYVGVDRICVFCSTPGKRRRSSFVCSGCTNKPHLCPKLCFAAYHK